VLVVLGACVAVVAVVAFWPEQKEPEYQGKKLSEWLAVYTGLPQETERESAGQTGSARDRHKGDSDSLEMEPL